MSESSSLNPHRRLRYFRPGTNESVSWNRLKAVPFTRRMECSFDLENLQTLIDNNHFTFEHFSYILYERFQNQKQAFAMCPHIRFPIRASMDELRETEGIPWLDTYLHNFYTCFLEMLGKLKCTKTSQLREAFHKLEFRCLRKAYAPGSRGQKRSRKAFEKEFAANDSD